MSEPARHDASLFPMIGGYMVSRVVCAAAQLGLADLLELGPKTSEALADSTRVHAPSLYRLLRALAALGLLVEITPGLFKLSPLGAQLRTGTQGSMRNLALLFGSERAWHSWGQLLHSVRTGETASDYVFGMGGFEYFALHPELAAIFNEAMTEATHQMSSALIAAYDFSMLQTVVDVGGGSGSLIAAILTGFPQSLGIVFDVPSGIEETQSQLTAAGVADRCQVIQGDFFKSVPSGADAYLLKNVIHDWDDDHSSTILENCRRAMTRGGKLLLVERIVPEKVQTSPEHRQILLMDINMLVMSGGRERTEAEFHALLSAAGFKMTTIIPLGGQSVHSLIEAVPV